MAALRSESKAGAGLAAAANSPTSLGSAQTPGKALPWNLAKSVRVLACFALLVSDNAMF